MLVRSYLHKYVKSLSLSLSLSIYIYMYMTSYGYILLCMAISSYYVAICGHIQIYRAICCIYIYIYIYIYLFLFLGGRGRGRLDVWTCMLGVRTCVLVFVRLDLYSGYCILVGCLYTPSLGPVPKPG